MPAVQLGRLASPRYKHDITWLKTYAGIEVDMRETDAMPWHRTSTLEQKI